MVYRVFVEKKPGLAPEAAGLLTDCRAFLKLTGLSRVRILNRYDVEGVDRALFDYACGTVFSEPQLDLVTDEPDTKGAREVFAVEPLPGQFDQRADSAAQCIQLLSQGERPLVRSAKVYVLYGDLTEEEIGRVRNYVVNPVESRVAGLEKPDTLRLEVAAPGAVPVVEGFREMEEQALGALLEKLGLAMDLEDLKFLQSYFRDEEKRDPTMTEVRVVDTYWSDHCRHTTFSTHLDSVTAEDPAVAAAYDRYLAARREVYGEEGAAKRPRTLMDLATLGAKVLRKRGGLPELDKSEEINACSIHMDAVVDGKPEDWLLMFKNETHNHPTEIEPFGGAATCIGGCIRDPLSGRAYVHQALRLTGCGDPRTPLDETPRGKLPQRKIAVTAAAGYSSYGNQIGLATGHVAEVYHPGYVAKHLELGAVVGAAPASHVVRKTPEPGDVVILLGGRTGRDGIGGATGSSKSHNLSSLTTMASEVQKGNAPEERKLQRLFRDGDVTRKIKRCNDFGAGGVSVAIGELADGLRIDLDAVRKKYEGLDGTEIAISESQERMAVVTSPEDAPAVIAAAERENLEAYPVAHVTAEPRMVMTWQGQTVADLSRAFLSSNGTEKHADVRVEAKPRRDGSRPYHSLLDMASSLECASRRGLTERFDGSIGAGSVLMPFGGKTQRTPAQAMAALLPVLPGRHTEDCSVMAWGFDPEAMEADPYTGAVRSVVTSVAKLAAAGCDWRRAYLTFQEFFERLRTDPLRWGKPFSALLGALDAQLELGIAAIGGKDSMSGSFLDLDVPPTLVSFAIAPSRAGEVLSPEFKAPEHKVVLFAPADGSVKASAGAWDAFADARKACRVHAAWAVEHCLAEGVMNMAFGNRIGFEAEGDADWYAPVPGAVIAEIEGEEIPAGAVLLGKTTQIPEIALGGERAALDALLVANEKVLESVYPTRTAPDGAAITAVTAVPAAERPAPRIHSPEPMALIPVFPGTNCEYDTARALMDAGAKAEIVVVRNLTAADVSASVEAFAEKLKNAQMVVIPGGFSGGDEPDGSAKFITAFFRNPLVKERVTELLEQRDGLMLGICNGFQALIKLGLVPYGRILDTDETCPTLSYNTIGRHQSKIVRTRVCSNRSPWLAAAAPGEIYTVPISHGEGRFIASEALVRELAERGQIATQYVTEAGMPVGETDANPNGSVWAVEGITSPDGRVLGKMGHSERVGAGLYRNVPGHYDMGLFASAVRYFR